MNRKVLINKCKLMKSTVHKTMHKHGKMWIVSTLLFFAMLGSMSVVGHANTNSQLTNLVNNLPQQVEINSNVNKTTNVDKSSSQENQNKSNNPGNVQNIQDKAKNLHKVLVNNVAMLSARRDNTLNQRTKILGNKQQNNKVSQSNLNREPLTNTNSISNRQNNFVDNIQNKIIKSNSSQNLNKEPQIFNAPVVNTGDENSESQSSNSNVIRTGYDLGLKYKVYPDGNSNTSIEFTNGVACSDLSNFSKNHDVSSASTIKFDNNINTSHVTNMNGMFKNCQVSDLNLGNSFDTSHVADMSHMFNNDEELSDLTLPNIFDTSHVTDMSNMFSDDDELKSLTLPSTFDTSHVTNMSNMFSDAFNDEHSNSITIKSSNTKFANNAKLPNMYRELGPYTPDTPNDFNQGNVGTFTTDERPQSYNSGTYDGLNYTFNPLTDTLEFTNGTMTYNGGCFIPNNNRSIIGYIPTSDIQHIKFDNDINTNNVTSMSDMFNGLTLKSLDLGNSFDTSHVTNMNHMFNNDSGLSSLDLGNHFDTSKVTDMSHMFNNDSGLSSLDLGNQFNTSSVVDMKGMFDADHELQSLNLGNHFNTNKVTDMSVMFANLLDLHTLNLGSDFDTSNVTNMNLMFSNDPDLHSLDLGNYFDTSHVTDMSGMFTYGLKNGLETLTIDSPNTKFSPNAFKFNNFQQLNNPNVNYTYFPYTRQFGDNYVYVVAPVYMYKETKDHDSQGVITLSTPNNFADGNVGTFTVHLHATPNNINYQNYYNSEPVNISTIVSGGYLAINNDPDAKLVDHNQLVNEIPLTNIKNNTVKVVLENDGLTYTYNKANNSVEFIKGTADSDLSDFSQKDSRIRYASSIKFDSDVDTSKVTNMNGMFSGCANLRLLTLSNSFNTAKVNDMANMFSGDVSLQSLAGVEDDANFKTSNVTNMSGMFGGDASLKQIDLNNNFDTSKVSDMSDMFNGDRNLKSLILPKSFDTSNVENKDGMIINDNNLNLITIQSPRTKLLPKVLKYFAHDNNQIKSPIFNSNGKTYNHIYDIQFGYDPVPFYKELGQEDSNGRPFTIGHYRNTTSDANDFALGNVGTFITEKNPVINVTPINNHPKRPSIPNVPNNPSGPNIIPNIPNIPNSPSNPVTPNVPNNPVKPKHSDVRPEVPNSPRRYHRLVSRVNNPDNVKINQSAVYHGHKITRLAHKNLYWFYVIRPCLAHTDLVTIGRAKHYDKAFHPNQLITEKIDRIFRVSTKRGSVLRYEIHANLGKGYKRYFVTGNFKFTRNAYWQRKDLKMTRRFARKHHYMKALVVHNCLLHNSRRYTKRSTVKHLHKGAIVRAKGLVYITHSHQTRFYLNDGKWVTSNKNFVKLLVK